MPQAFFPSIRQKEPVRFLIQVLFYHLKGDVVVQVAGFDPDNKGDWLSLGEETAKTGDWRKDIVAVAETQVGYKESEIDFILDGDGNRMGYNIYGDEYGHPYDDWCAMFQRWCIETAGVPSRDYPRDTGCNSWKWALIEADAYMDEEHHYQPQAGDLVFISINGSNTPDHIGLVTDASESTVTVIEGNHFNAVCKSEYAQSDKKIVGYGNTTRLMERAGAIAAPDA